MSKLANQEEVKQLEDRLINEICCIKEDIEDLQLLTCTEIDNCLEAKYTGPGLRFLSYDGNNIEFNGVPSGEIFNTVISLTAASSPYTVTNTLGDVYIFCNTIGGPIEINLNTAVNNQARFIIKKKDGTANYVDVIPNGLEAIDDDTVHRILFKNTALSIKSDNTQWWTV